MKEEIETRKISFSPPDISDLEVQYVSEALKSGWITTGPRTKLLEKKISGWLQNYNGEGTPRCVCLNSATAALELSLRILGIGPQEGGSSKDEVITCAYSYTSSASIISHVNAKTVFVDCSLKKGSIEMDYTALEDAITERTKAIIPIDIGGIPCDYDRIYEIVNRKRNVFIAKNPFQKAIGRIAVVADSAHGFGASYKGKMLGSVADITCFSFHAVKNYTTAEGGALLWNHFDGMDDGEIYHKLQLYSLHGQSKDALAKTGLGTWEYDIVGTWFKCNMTDLTAAMGLAQLERYPGLLERRKQIIRRYDEAFMPLGLDVLEHYTKDYNSSGHLYITRIPGADRDLTNRIMKKMGERGIATNVHFKPLPMHTAYKNMGFDIKDYPNAFSKYKNAITLPLHTKLTDADVEYIIKNYCEIISELINGNN